MGRRIVEPTPSQNVALMRAPPRGSLWFLLKTDGVKLCFNFFEK